MSKRVSTRGRNKRLNEYARRSARPEEKEEKRHQKTTKTKVRKVRRKYRTGRGGKNLTFAGTELKKSAGQGGFMHLFGKEAGKGLPVPINRREQRNDRPIS